MKADSQDNLIALVEGHVRGKSGLEVGGPSAISSGRVASSRSMSSRASWTIAISSRARCGVPRSSRARLLVLRGQAGRLPVPSRSVGPASHRFVLVRLRLLLSHARALRQPDPGARGVGTRPEGGRAPVHGSAASRRHVRSPSPSHHAVAHYRGPRQWRGRRPTWRMCRRSSNYTTCRWIPVRAPPINSGVVRSKTSATGACISTCSTPRSWCNCSRSSRLPALVRRPVSAVSHRGVRESPQTRRCAQQFRVHGKAASMLRREPVSVGPARKAGAAGVHLQASRVGRPPAGSLRPLGSDSAPSLRYVSTP